MSPRRAVAAAVTALMLVGCGYHLSGRGTTLPEHVRRVALPLFENESRQPDIAQRITEQVADEFVRRGDYVITSSGDDAEAILQGTVVWYRSRPVVIDQDGRATRYEIEVQVRAELRDLVEDRSLWKDDYYVFRQQYEVDAEEQDYFDRSILAIDLVSRDVARSMVATILEGW